MTQLFLWLDWFPVRGDGDENEDDDEDGETDEGEPLQSYFDRES